VLSKLTDLCITKSGKWITLVIWLVLASVIIGLSPSLNTSANMANFLPDEAESTKAYELSAGLILAGTFSALISLPLLDLMQLGIAVAVGVLMDTFITRTLIVPAIIKLLGRWNWWPNNIRVISS